MAYDVDFWYISQDACQISTDFTPFTEAEEESIYMKTSDFFKMVEEFTDPDLERKARAWGNYMIDTYIYDKVYSDGDHKEAYDFYMKPDVKSYIDCLNKELADTGHFINSVEEYRQILNEIEDKQND